MLSSIRDVFKSDNLVNAKTNFEEEKIILEYIKFHSEQFLQLDELDENYIYNTFESFIVQLVKISNRVYKQIKEKPFGSDLFFYSFDPLSAYSIIKSTIRAFNQIKESHPPKTISINSINPNNITLIEFSSIQLEFGESLKNLRETLKGLFQLNTLILSDNWITDEAFNQLFELDFRQKDPFKDSWLLSKEKCGKYQLNYIDLSRNLLQLKVFSAIPLYREHKNKLADLKIKFDVSANYTAVINDCHLDINMSWKSNIENWKDIFLSKQSRVESILGSYLVEYGKPVAVTLRDVALGHAFNIVEYMNIHGELALSEYHYGIRQANDYFCSFYFSNFQHYIDSSRFSEFIKSRHQRYKVSSWSQTNSDLIREMHMNYYVYIQAEKGIKTNSMLDNTLTFFSRITLLDNCVVEAKKQILNSRESSFENTGLNILTDVNCDYIPYDQRLSLTK